MTTTFKTSGTQFFCSVEEGAEIQTKYIKNLFNNITAGHFPNLAREMGI
jgi:hypothetical protein